MQNQPTRWAKFLRDNQPVHSFLRADEETMITECLEDTISITGGAERSGTLGWRNSHRAARLEVATWHTSEVSSSRRELRGLGRSEHISLRSMYPVLDRLSEAVASSRRINHQSSNQKSTLLWKRKSFGSSSFRRFWQSFLRLLPPLGSHPV